MAQEQFNDWYKKRFEGLNEQPSEDVWDNISNQLDLNDVWKGVDAGLNQIERKRFLLHLSLNTLFFLLIFGGGVLFFFKFNTSTNKIATNKINLEKNEKHLTLEEDSLKIESALNNEYRSNSDSAGFNNDLLWNMYVKTDCPSVAQKATNTHGVNAVNDINDAMYAPYASNKSAVNNKAESISIDNNNTNLKTQSAGNTKSSNNLNQVAYQRKDKQVVGDLNTETSHKTSGVHNSNHIRYTNENEYKNENKKNKSSRSIKRDRSVGYVYDTEKIVDNSNDSLIYISPKYMLLNNTLKLDSSFFTILPVNSGIDTKAPTNYKNDYPFKGFYGGVVYNYNNTWLLNNTTYSGLSSNSLDQTNLNFGYAYGITAGYYLNKIWSAELNWYINSQQGQTYHMYNEGMYSKKKISFDFQVVNFSMKRINRTSLTYKNVQVSGSLITGVNIGMLKDDNDKISSSSGKVKTDYSKIDYGFRLGYEYDFLLFHRIIIAPALKGDFGLKNIWRGNSIIPSDFNRTNTASVGFNLGIRYLFQIK